MTNESISGFLNSIAEAKRAFDAEPEHLQRIADLEADQRRLGDTIAARELRIHSLKQDNDALLGKLRSVEAERDDAGFRALEEADRVSNLLGTLRQFVGDGLKVISAVTGEEQVIISKESLTDINKVNHEQAQAIAGLTSQVAQRAEELEHLQRDMRYAQEQLQRPLASQGATAQSSSNVEGTDPYFKPYEWPSDMPGQSETVPTASASDPIPQGLGNEPPATQEQTSFNHVPEGQSEGPFASPVHTQSETASSGTATSTDGVPSSASPPERNRDRSTFFTGRKYFDITYFVPLHQWLNEGGSREDYYWRPAEANVPLPEANRASHNS